MSLVGAIGVVSGYHQAVVIANSLVVHWLPFGNLSPKATCR
jgi:hypothetical protein